MIEFKPWGKTPRMFRDIQITEKIDGTNSAIIFTEEGFVGAQSRNRLITPGKSTDNYGFAGWVEDNAADLYDLLGPGHHFGEWWGQGIARKYDQETKRFSLFNADRYGVAASESDLIDVVPVLYRGPYSEEVIRNSIIALKNGGSWAAPGFRNPEGVIVFHSASRQVYKVLIENDELPKSVQYSVEGALARLAAA